MDNLKASSQLDQNSRWTRTYSNRPPLSPSTKMQPIQSEAKSVSRLNNRQLEHLALEIENFVLELQEGSDLLRKSTNKEKQDWIAEKERALNLIAKQFELASIGASQQQIMSCENLIQNAQQLLSRMATLDANQDEIQRVINREQRLRELQRESMDQRSDKKPSQQVIQQKLEDLRAKEDHIDQDFQRLLNRYNQSKELIDKITTQTTGQPIFKEAKQSKLLSASKKLSPQKLTDINNHDTVSNRNLLISKNDEYLNTEQTYSVKSKENKRTGQSSMAQIIPEKDKNVQSSLKKLKDTIQIKENLEREKIDRQRALIRDLKQALKECIQKNQEMEQSIYIKDDLINKYEVELKNSQEDLLINIDRIKEIKLKEEAWVKLELEYRAQMQDLQDKVMKKKKKSAFWK